MTMPRFRGTMVEINALAINGTVYRKRPRPAHVYLGIWAAATPVPISIFLRKYNVSPTSRAV